MPQIQTKCRADFDDFQKASKQISNGITLHVGQGIPLEQQSQQYDTLDCEFISQPSWHLPFGLGDI